MTDKDIQELCDMIRTSKFYERFGRKNNWMSGSSTIVHSIQVWKHSVNIQLDKTHGVKGRSESFRNLFRKMKKRFPRITSGLWRSDGSCPWEYIIRFNNHLKEDVA